MAEVSDALGDAPKTTGGRHRRSVRQHRVDDPLRCAVPVPAGRLLHEGERVALLALASGLEIGALIFTVDEIVDRYGHTH